jgi:hypothetical protein
MGILLWLVLALVVVALVQPSLGMVAALALGFAWGRLTGRRARPTASTTSTPTNRRRT